MKPTADTSSPNEFPPTLSRRAALRQGAVLAAGLMAAPSLMAAGTRRVVCWSEGTANVDPGSKGIYPDDINTAIADGLKPLEARGWEVGKAGLNDPDQGLSVERLEKTDVLIWWGHKRHGDVKDELVARIVERVNEGKMGFIGTHSAHFSKALKRLLKAECSWREYVADGTSAEILVQLPDHPICKGVTNFKIKKIERYGEPYKVPTPDAVPLDGIYTRPDGRTEHGRMGMCWNVGKGRVFYFTPGHETYNDYHLPEVRRIFVNAVEWAAPTA